MAGNLHVIYRISDKGNPNPKLPNAGKWNSLKNAFTNLFDASKGDSFHVIADNCTAETIDALKSTGLSMETTANGNSGTFKYILNEVISRYAPDDNLYLLEDDYLHLPGSREAILEGLEIADYVTLYDHPFMYLINGVSWNPFVHDDMPKSSIYLTPHTHWRTTTATTMTFAAKMKTLLEDRDVWNSFCTKKAPEDFKAFVFLTGQDDMEEAKFLAKSRHPLARTMLELVINNHLSGRNKKRTLISPIPSLSTHTDIGPACIAPRIDWSKV